MVTWLEVILWAALTPFTVWGWASFMERVAE